MKRIILILAFGLAIVAFGALYRSRALESSDLPTRAAVAAEASASWLASYPYPYGDPGVVWIIDDINDQFCRSETVAGLVEEKWEEFASSPVQRYYRRLIDPKFAPNPGVLPTSSTLYDDVLIPALYCDLRPLPTGTRTRIADLGQKTGYDLTHAYLANLFIHQRSCTAQDESLTTHRLLADEIAREQASAAAVDDLYAERIAFLLYGGFPDAVKPEWIERLVGAQNLNGSFANPLLFGRTEDPHATALALWGLTYFTRRCPFQD